MDKFPIVLITLGDPAGSGPELAMKTALNSSVKSTCIPVIIGSPDIVSDALKRIRKRPKLNLIDGKENLRSSQIFAENALQVLPLSELKPNHFEKGVPSATTGRNIVEISRTATKLARERAVDAICSAPASKVSLRLAGYPYNGITDVFLETLGLNKCGSMLVLGKIRLVLATAHVPFASIPAILRPELIVESVISLNEALEDFFQITRPKIGIAALNPHAGEGGVYGTEEKDILYPAIDTLRLKGFTVSGPIPADFLIPKIKSGDLDGGVMLYHDQAHIPLKAVGLFEPATLLLGLPIIRTSVAHGTVFGKAKSGTADPVGMINACVLAAKLAVRRQELQWKQ